MLFERTFFCGFVFLAALPVLLAAPAQAQRLDQLPTLQSAASFQVAPSAPTLATGIAVVVNEDIISTSDVRHRIELAILSAGLPDTQEVHDKIGPQVIQALIREKLQLQEGKKLGITVSDEEIDQAMNRLAADNKIPGGDMAAFLTANNIPPSALRNQVRATLTWNKYVMRALRPRVDIGEDEIDAVIQRQRANAGKQEFLVSEIFLPVDKPAEEAEMKALAQKLTDQLKEGAVFGSVARQFSRNAGAASGGDMGWIQAGQLEAALDKTLATMQAGDIAGPVRSTTGYHILGLREKRTITVGESRTAKVKLQQAFHPYEAGQGKEVLLVEADRMRQEIHGCNGLASELSRKFPGWRWQDLGEVDLATAPSWLAAKVVDIPDGRASEAMATNKGALVLFVCGRDKTETVDRETIRLAIGTERLELLAERQLRDLRREAFLDVRLKAMP